MRFLFPILPIFFMFITLPFIKLFNYQNTIADLGFYTNHLYNISENFELWRVFSGHIQIILIPLAFIIDFLSLNHSIFLITLQIFFIISVFFFFYFKKRIFTIVNILTISW